MIRQGFNRPSSSTVREDFEQSLVRVGQSDHFMTKQAITLRPRLGQYQRQIHNSSTHSRALRKLQSKVMASLTRPSMLRQGCKLLAGRTASSAFRRVKPAALSRKPLRSNSITSLFRSSRFSLTPIAPAAFHNSAAHKILPPLPRESVLLLVPIDGDVDPLL